MKQFNSMNNLKSVQLARYNNSWYRPAPPWKVWLWTLLNVCFFNNGLALFNGLKCWMLRRFGAQLGNGVVIKRWVSIKYPWFLEIGNNVWIGEKVWIDNLTNVHIGNNVCISQGALLLTGNHNYSKETFDLMVGAITLEDGVWLGANSTVCAGVTCATHAMLTVGSVATKNLDSYSIYQGNPAVKTKRRNIM